MDVLRRVAFIGRVAALYMTTLGLVGYIVFPALLATKPPATTKAYRPRQNSVVTQPVSLSGKPVRIVIADYGIDLPVDDGTYAEDGSWTLSDTRAQFAVMTNHANENTGNTFIYGHGTDMVFGKLSSKPPLPGAIAKLYTHNGLIFEYTFQESRNVTPDDTSVLEEATNGSPRLTIQTCTGTWNEWRTLFVFAYEKVERAA